MKTTTERKPHKRELNVNTLKDCIGALCDVSASQNNMVKSLIEENHSLLKEVVQLRQGAEMLRQALIETGEYMILRGIMDDFTEWRNRSDSDADEEIPQWMLDVAAKC